MKDHLFESKDDITYEESVEKALKKEATITHSRNKNQQHRTTNHQEHKKPRSQLNIAPIVNHRATPHSISNNTCPIKANKCQVCGKVTMKPLNQSMFKLFIQEFQVHELK